MIIREVVSICVTNPCIEGPRANKTRSPISFLPPSPPPLTISQGGGEEVDRSDGTETEQQNSSSSTSDYVDSEMFT